MSRRISSWIRVSASFGTTSHATCSMRAIASRTIFSVIGPNASQAIFSIVSRSSARAIAGAADGARLRRPSRWAPRTTRCRPRARRRGRPRAGSGANGGSAVEIVVARGQRLADHHGRVLERIALRTDRALARGVGRDRPARSWSRTDPRRTASSPGSAERRVERIGLGEIELRVFGRERKALRAVLDREDLGGGCGSARVVEVRGGDVEARARRGIEQRRVTELVGIDRLAERVAALFAIERELERVVRRGSADRAGLRSSRLLARVAVAGARSRPRTQAARRPAPGDRRRDRRRRTRTRRRARRGRTPRRKRPAQARRPAARRRRSRTRRRARASGRRPRRVAACGRAAARCAAALARGAGAAASSCFTRSTSVCASNGFATWPAAPTAVARAWSKASNVPVSSSTGMWRRFGSAFTVSQTS